MFKSNSFTDYLCLGIAFLPLVPALLIFVRRVYLQEPLNLLLIICLLCFLRNFSFGSFLFVGHILDLLLFLSLVWAFRSNLKGRVRYGVTLLLTALLAIVCTCWGQAGWNAFVIPLVLNGFIGAVIGFSLPKVIRNTELQIFRSRLFWMEAGTLFYILLFLLLFPMGPDADPDRRVIISLADLVRYGLYVVAAAL